MKKYDDFIFSKFKGNKTRAFFKKLPKIIIILVIIAISSKFMSVWDIIISVIGFSLVSICITGKR